MIHLFQISGTDRAGKPDILPDTEQIFFGQEGIQRGISGVNGSVINADSLPGALHKLAGKGAALLLRLRQPQLQFMAAAVDQCDIAAGNRILPGFFRQKMMELSCFLPQGCHTIQDILKRENDPCNHRLHAADKIENCQPVFAKVLVLPYRVQRPFRNGGSVSGNCRKNHGACQVEKAQHRIFLSGRQNVFSVPRGQDPGANPIHNRIAGQQQCQIHYRMFRIQGREPDGHNPAAQKNRHHTFQTGAQQTAGQKSGPCDLKTIFCPCHSDQVGQEGSHPQNQKHGRGGKR